MSTTIFKVALKLKLLTAFALIALAKLIFQKMNGNAAFPSPPSLLTLQTKTNDYDTAKQTLDAAKLTLKQAAADEKAKRKILELYLNDEARYVDTIAQGDKNIILSAGMNATDEPDPIHLGQVEDLSLTRGDNPGSVDAHWHADDKATNYTHEISHTAPDPTGAAPWEQATTVPKSSCTITGLQSGSGVWVHVRANGSNGNGAFSDPAFLIVP